jgi:hypothetical protein
MTLEGAPEGSELDIIISFNCDQWYAPLSNMALLCIVRVDSNQLLGRGQGMNSVQVSNAWKKVPSISRAAVALQLPKQARNC